MQAKCDMRHNILVTRTRKVTYIERLGPLVGDIEMKREEDEFRERGSPRTRRKEEVPS